jgi:hypothetical protein
MLNFSPHRGQARKDLSRARTGVLELSTNFMFSATEKIGSRPKQLATIWVSIWILLMTQEFKHMQF